MFTVTVSDQDKDIKILQSMIQIKRRIFTDSCSINVYSVEDKDDIINITVIDYLGKDDNIYSH